MKRNLKFSMAIVLAALGGFSVAQFDMKSIFKVGGVALLVDRFGGDMNKALNRLVKHQDSPKVKTKVVTILSVGVGRSSAVGAAQIMGPPDKVDQVVAVAQPEADLLGREIRVRALVPVSDKNVSRGLKTVSGVGVSGLVDIKL
jgi:hypothetical protein